MLLAYGSKVDDINGQRWTPLMIAAEEGNTNVLEVLIENKANVQLKEQEGLTAVHMAAWNGQARAARMLLANGSIVDDTCGQGRTPLMIAAEKGKTNVLEVLIENKAACMWQPVMINLRRSRCYLQMAVKWMKPMARDGLN